MNKIRIAVAALSFTAAGIVGIWMDEGWFDRAAIPVKGDVATVGPGLTKRPDGSPVQLGDTIKPLDGAQRSLAHIQKDEAGIKRCITADLNQAEYDVMVDFAYQYGVPTLCRSSIARHANAGRYKESCESYLLYRFAGGYDCSTPGNRRCPGVWKRSQARHQKCMEAQ